MKPYGFARSLWQKLYRKYAVREHVDIGTNVHIGIGSILWAPHRLSLGNDVYIGKNCTIECNGSIGSNVLIANGVGLVGRLDHDFSALGIPVRQAPWIGDDHSAERIEDNIIIEDDVWIGYGAVVLSGVRVGRGSIVAAASVVTRDVLPYMIIAGNPAKPMKARFTRYEAELHERTIYGSIVSDLEHLPYSSHIVESMA